jgi:hypothetical protein
LLDAALARRGRLLRGFGALLNVAISRAQALAVLVASPKLLEIRCRSIEDMRLVNALCRFVELASPAG